MSADLDRLLAAISDGTGMTRDESRATLGRALDRAAGTPEVVAVVHVVSTPKTVDFGPFRDGHHTPTCCVCGPLGSPLSLYDARVVRFQHQRDVEAAARAQDNTDGAL